jgi:hypothetical protein
MQQRNPVLLQTAVIGLCLLLYVCFQSTDAMAGEDQANVLYAQGNQDYDNQNWRRAAEKFALSYRQYKHSFIALMAADSLHKVVIKGLQRQPQDIQDIQKYARLALKDGPRLGQYERIRANDLLRVAKEFSAATRKLDDIKISGSADNMGPRMRPVTGSLPAPSKLPPRK